MSEKTKKPANPAVVQTVKTIAVLVVICLVCVALLALCNDLLYVSEEEDFERKVRKVYDGYTASTTFEEQNRDPVFSTNPSYGEVSAAYKASDGSYVIVAKGTGGFNGGNVTILVAISPNPDSKILGWLIQKNEGQTFIANITEEYTKSWFVGSLVSDVQPTVTPDAGQGKGSGATYTENALSNAINMACYYCQNVFGLGANPEGDAKKALLQLLGGDYADYTFNTVNISGATIDSSISVAQALSDGDNTLTYLMCATGSQGNVFGYVYGEGDEAKLVAVTANGIIHSDNVVETDEYYTKIIANPIYTFTYGSYQAYAMVTGNKDGVYNVTGLKVGVVPNDYVLSITIEADSDGKGVVTAITATHSGFVDHGPPQSNTDKLLTSLVGARLDNIDSLYTNNKVAGATQSANLIRVAVEAALTSFDAANASSN